MNTLLRRSLPGNRILSAEAVDNAACARRRILERVTDYGILVIDKPFPVQRIGHAMRFLSAQQSRLKKLEQKVQAAEDKVQELRLIDKAKFLLVERKRMTEEEAHRYIGKQAMNHGVSRKRIAQQILDDE